MKNLILSCALATSLLSPSAGQATTQNTQCEGPVALQILGSGGPIAEGPRAGSSAIIWIDGKAAILVDTGSGAFVRYAQAGAKFEDHQAILLTHFHVDHVGDLGSLLKSGGFSDRVDPLPIFGPTGEGVFPGLIAHLNVLLNKETGAFAYMSGYLDGTDGRAKLIPHEVDVKNKSSQMIFEKDGIKITAIPVHHGPVPATGYKIEVRDKIFVFAGDQSFLSTEFVAGLSNSKPDILVAHNVIPEGGGQPRGLHRNPTSIGEMAAAINPGILLLSHNMKRATDRQEEGEAAIAKNYSGELRVVNDLDCFTP